MAITIYNLKKWWKMINGNSLMHVEQGIGKVFSINDIEGYYNDLTKKVTEDKNILYSRELPLNIIENGEKVLFPIQIFQYGLGSYDLYLISKEKIYLEKFKLCLEWALENQEKNGAWNTFYFVYPEAPYSAMSQGEGVSLLLRGFKYYNKEKYLTQAKQAIDFMLKPIEEGGTLKKINERIIFFEYTNQPIVLNGWIFALFGLYDYILISKDKKYEKIFKNSIDALKEYLIKFDNGYWSMYNSEKMLASPFYHKLHIAQLQALYRITKDELFEEYAIKWEKYLNKGYNKKKAFLIKVFQKILEKR